jgi:hypothetical protein
MASNNFLQFDTTKSNLQSDAAYASETDRTHGVQTGAARSNVHNKLFYQVSTMVAGLAQAMADKGFAMSDSNLVTLTAQLAHIMTDADMSPYALTSALSAYIAKAAVIIKTENYIVSSSDYFKTFEANKSSAISFTLEAAGTPANGSWIKFKNIGIGLLTVMGIVDGVTNPTLAQYDEIIIYTDGSAWRGKVSTGFGPSTFVASLTENGYQKLPSGLIMQWGRASVTYTFGVPDSSIVVFPIAFPHACFSIVGQMHHGIWGATGPLVLSAVSSTGATFYLTEDSGMDYVHWQATGW